jgi:hypothetical protein
LGCTREKATQRQEFIDVDEEFCSFGERFCLHIIRDFDTEVIVSDGAEDLVHLSNLLLIVEEDWGIKIRDLLRLDRFANQVFLAWVLKFSDLCHLVWGSLILRTKTKRQKIEGGGPDLTRFDFWHQKLLIPFDI